MGKKLYVGSIAFSATQESLREIFSGIGEVESIKIITDAETGRSRGFGFIEMSSADDAKKAIEQLNGTKFMERALIVTEARPQQPREGRGFGRGSGGGFGQRRGSGYGRDRR